MKLRIAKKILRDMDVWINDYERPLWSYFKIEQARARMYRYEKKSPREKVFKASIRLRKFIDAHPDDPESIQDQWQKLRAQIRRDWHPEYWDEALYQQALLRWNEDLTKKRKLKAENPESVSNNYLNDPIVRLRSDISYYSDRWCEWRVAFVDRTVEWLMNDYRGKNT